MLYKNDGEARIAKHNCTEGRNDSQDSSNEDVLLENFTSCDGP